jgi:hypothetical protein
MSFEHAPNKFRASVLNPKASESPVVTTKKGRLDRSAGGLSGMPVPRSETRRSNSRGKDRHRLASTSATVRKGRKEYPVELINVSGGGAMVEGEFAVKLWQTVTLILGDVGPVECAVRWIRSNRYGLEFAHETHIECDPETLKETLRRVLIESPPEEEEQTGTEPDEVPATADPRRCATRHPLIWSGLIQFNHETSVARLRNISSTGAQVESTADYPVGSDVLLDLGNAGVVPAMVQWSHGDHCGLAFHTAFDVRLLASVRPSVTPREWAKPDYLKDESHATSPWASQWGRLTLKDLTETLCG